MTASSSVPAGPRPDADRTLSFSWFDGARPLDRDPLVAIWVAVTNAGGAVGFLPPVTVAGVTPLAEKTFDRVDAGSDALLVASVGEAPIGWLVLERDGRAHAAHWRTLKRFQVHPDQQRGGIGRSMLAEASRYAGDELDLDFLLLTVRDGTGIGGFYERFGYREVGRIPGALRLAPGDLRDEVVMVIDVGGRQATPPG